jgi:transcription antitermination factor NusG
VAIELTPLGEQKIEEGTLERSLRQDLDVELDFPVFIPAVNYMKGKKGVTIHLMEGYAFVAAGLPEVRYFALEQRPYIEQIISIESPRKIRTISVIPDRNIRDLRRQLQERVASDIQVGEHVRITEGQYARLDGLVTAMNGSDAYVFIKLRSLQVVATVPRIFLEALEDEEDAGRATALPFFEV